MEHTVLIFEVAFPIFEVMFPIFEVMFPIFEVTFQIFEILSSNILYGRNPRLKHSFFAYYENG